MKNKIVCWLCLFLIAGFICCQNDGGNEQGFVEQNRASITIHKLNNGIPVIMKKTDGNRIFSLVIGLKGNVMLTSVEKAGLEAVTLTMLTKGSEKYNYEQLKKILFEKSSSIQVFCNSFDYSAFSLITIDKYFDSLYPVFMDGFLHPSWDKKEFDKVIHDMQIINQQVMSDPYARMVNRLHDYFFKDHPYLADFGGTDDSLGTITLEDVKKYYNDTFVPERICVVAVGNINTGQLLDYLNKTLGSLKDKELIIPDVPSFKPIERTEAYFESFEASEGVAFVRADMTIPPVSHADYPPLLLASAMLDDLLYEIVRIQHGAAYGIWFNLFGFKENYASLVVYKTTVPEKVKHYIDKAIALMTAGQCMGVKVKVSAAGKGGIGEADNHDPEEENYVPLDEALDFYKAQFITQYYGSQDSSYSIAFQILSSIIYYDDPGAYLDFIARINAVSAQDIIRVVKKYIYEQPKIWIVLSSRDVLDKIDRRDYLDFIDPQSW